MTEQERELALACSVQLEALKGDIVKADEAKLRAIVIFSAMREWTRQRNRVQKDMER